MCTVVIFVVVEADRKKQGLFTGVGLRRAQETQI